MTAAARPARRRRVGLAAALAGTAGILLLLVARPARTIPEGVPAFIRLVESGGTHGPPTYTAVVSNATAQPLNWLPFGQIETQPALNRAGFALPGFPSRWILAPGATSTIVLPAPYPGPKTPWRLLLFCRPWRGAFAERLDDLRESARNRGVPLAPAHPFQIVASDWEGVSSTTPPLRLNPSR